MERMRIWDFFLFGKRERERVGGGRNGMRVFCGIVVSWLPARGGGGMDKREGKGRDAKRGDGAEGISMGGGGWGEVERKGRKGRGGEK